MRVEHRGALLQTGLGSHGHGESTSGASPSLALSPISSRSAPVTNARLCAARQEAFEDTTLAAAAYKAAEAEYRNDTDVVEFEVVLVGADSIETVEQTDGHYFQYADEAMFAELLARH